MTTYSAELAKSSRASCKRCKGKIEKDALRIGVHSQAADGIEFSSWTHLACFRPPKKLSTDEFLQQLAMPDLSEEARQQVKDTFLSPAAPSPGGAPNVSPSPASQKKRPSAVAVDGETSGAKKSRLVSYICCLV
jgi:hypothetical protein